LGSLRAISGMYRLESVLSFCGALGLNRVRTLMNKLKKIVLDYANIMPY
jgi:endo-1,4-beta-mannosidase